MASLERRRCGLVSATASFGRQPGTSPVGRDEQTE